MLSVVTLGFLIGKRHALEADHLAAVTSIASKEICTLRIVRHGVAWGAGHSITLFGFAGAAIQLRESISVWLATGLEFVVGVMLVVLGLRVIYRLTRYKVHIQITARIVSPDPSVISPARTRRATSLYQRSLILTPFTAVGLGQIFAASQEHVAP